MQSSMSDGSDVRYEIGVNGVEYVVRGWFRSDDSSSDSGTYRVEISGGRLSGVDATWKPLAVLKSQDDEVVHLMCFKYADAVSVLQDVLRDYAT